MTTVGRYELIAELGRGGMGAVHRARDPLLGREVALKLILAARAADPAARKRFAREVAALARLRHTHVVAILDAGEHEGVPFFVMPLVEGARTLQARLEAEGPLPPRAACALFAGLARALEHAHAAGVLHRDVKPDNVLLDARGAPLLTDFGLTRDLVRSGPESSVSMRGQLLGTPDFWPPEQAAGELERIGPPADVYGLGATLFAALTGRPPFESQSLFDAVRAVREDAPQPASSLRPDVPPELDAVCARCLAKAPEARYPVADLARELERLAAGGFASPRRPWRRAGAGAAAALAAGALLLAAVGPGRRPTATPGAGDDRAAALRAALLSPWSDPAALRAQADDLAGAPAVARAAAAIALARDPGARSSAQVLAALEAALAAAGDDAPLRAALHLAAGEHLRRRARLDEALAHAERVLDAGAGPAALEAHHLRATCLAQLRRVDDATAARRALLALDPPEPHALLARAGLAMDHRPDDAARWLREALALEPWRHQARLRLVTVLQHLGRLDEVDAELARLEGDAPADDQLFHLVRGMALTNRGRPDEALAALDRAVALGEPDPDPAALLARANAHLARGDRAAARADLDRSLRARDDVLALLQRGALSAEEGRTEEAEADWRRAHDLDHERADRLVERLEPAGLRRHACHTVGLIEAGPGPLELSDRARDRLERLAEQVTPTSARRRLAAALHAAGSGHPFRRFEPALRRGLELAPTSWPAALVAARLLAGRDHFDEALTELTRARRLGAPAGPVELLRGEALWLRGDGNEAVRAWEALAREAPTSGEGRCAAAWVAFARGDLAGAARAAEALVVARPDLTSAAVAGGAACGTAREWSRSQALLARALDAEGALSGFVPMLLAVSEVEVALEAAAQRGGAPGPDFDEAMRRLASLHSLGHAMPRMASTRLALTAGAAGGRWSGRVVRWLDEAERAEPARGEVDVWRGVHALLRPDGAADEVLACWRAARGKTPRLVVPSGYLELFRRRFGDDPLLAELAPR